ncbi:GxxExxY protein [Pelagicoccus mobilis]|uniref:GxxExxY protein n=1 Tax=Pelagicoccus mobilis TaxID=415221 RepID=A0A934S6A0_9BACT|nr:GxxExxY protein [Pelagicoccus mobilis]MBK1880164.1 GxxExxY protein [Pelagicoccus mobilis]
MENDSLTQLVIGICFDVHNELRTGYAEKVYENSLCIALREEGFDVEQQHPIEIMFRGHVVGEYFADLIVNGELVLELKAVKALLPEHRAQLINYLRGTNTRRGLLLNFAPPRLEVQRAYNPELS